nr:hypothetical protein 4 [Coxiellaceae bacterium]
MKIYPINDRAWFDHLKLLVKQLQVVHTSETEWKDSLTRQQQLETSLSDCEARLIVIRNQLEDLTLEAVSLAQTYSKDKKAALDKKTAEEKAADDAFEKTIEPLKSGMIASINQNGFDKVDELMRKIREAQKVLQDEKTKIADAYQVTLAKLDKDYEEKKADLKKRTDAKEGEQATEDREWHGLTGQLKDLAQTLHKQSDKLSDAYTLTGKSIQKLKTQLENQDKPGLERQTQQKLAALTSEGKAALKERSASNLMAVDQAVSILNQLISADKATFPDTRPLNHLAGLTRDVSVSETDQREWASDVIRHYRTRKQAHNHLNKSRVQQAIDDLKAEQRKAEQQHKEEHQQAIVQHEAQIAEADQQFNAIKARLEEQLQAAMQAQDYMRVAELGKQLADEKLQHEEKKAGISKSHKSKLESLDSAYQRNKKTSEFSMQQLVTAKSAKQRKLQALADKIEHQHHVIQTHKATLLKDLIQIRDQIRLLKYSVQAHEADVIKRDLNYKPGIFKLNAAQQVERKAQSIVKAGKVTGEEINTILKAVTEGQLNTVQQCLEKNPDLIYAQGDVTDPAGRFFPKVTVLQYASWACDMEICDLLMRYLSKHECAKQLQAMDYHRPDITEQHGKQFDFAPLIERYDTYLKNYGGWSYKQCCEGWSKVGAAQKMLPDWIILMMTEKGDKVAWTLNDVRKPVDRAPNHHSIRFRQDIVSYSYSWCRGRGGSARCSVSWVRGWVDSGVVLKLYNTAKDYNLSLRVNSETDLSRDSTPAHRPGQ